MRFVRLHSGRKRDIQSASVAYWNRLAHDGTPDRIKLKSMDADMFAGLMRDRADHVTFVDLQYGDVRSVIADWKSQGLPVLHETSVNPLKNMEELFDR